jgi:hypothetical protein
MIETPVLSLPCGFATPPSPPMLPKFPSLTPQTASRFSSPYAIGTWFGPQQIIELLYIKELFYPSGGKVEQVSLSLAPCFALGNLMIGTWPFFVSLTVSLFVSPSSMLN